LDVAAENEKMRNNPYSDPAYKSDYEKFLEMEDVDDE
jgi:hypothetical protein